MMLIFTPSLRGGTTWQSFFYRYCDPPAGGVAICNRRRKKPYVNAQAEKWDNAKEQRDCRSATAFAHSASWRIRNDVINVVIARRNDVAICNRRRKKPLLTHKQKNGTMQRNKQIATAPLRFWPLRQLADSQ
jgi:hypothetical protein